MFLYEERSDQSDQTSQISPGQIIAIENGEIVVRFDGYGPRHDKHIQLNEITSKEIRAPTRDCSSISYTSCQEIKEKKGFKTTVK